MRILLCHPGHSFSTSDVFDGLLTGLTAAGADVVTFRWDQIMQRLGAFVAGAAAAGVVRPDQQERAHDFMAWLAAADALSLAVEYEVDAVLVITGTLFPPSRLKPLRKLGIPVACYGTEAPYFEETERAMAPFYTHWFTQERTSVPVYASAVPGGRAFYLPMAYNPATHAPAPPDPAYACDVSFVGGGYRERRAMFPGLAWAGVNAHGRWMPDIDLQVRGTLWHLDLDAEQGATGGSRGSRYAEGSIDNEETVRWHRSAAIALNMHRRMTLVESTAVIPAGLAESLGPRPYEIPAVGGFLLSDDERPELRDVFGDSAATFRAWDSADLERQIRYWLAHPDERERRRAAQQEAVRPHTWEARARVILDTLCA